MDEAREPADQFNVIKNGMGAALCILWGRVPIASGSLREQRPLRVGDGRCGGSTNGACAIVQQTTCCRLQVSSAVRDTILHVSLADGSRGRTHRSVGRRGSDVFICLTSVVYDFSLCPIAPASRLQSSFRLGMLWPGGGDEWLQIDKRWFVLKGSKHSCRISGHAAVGGPLAVVVL